MEAIEVKVGVRTLEIVTEEAEKLTNLIYQREFWLADPINKMKKTWDAVNKDTRDLIWQLKELKQELDELKKAQ